jgi:hypothetical protein
MPSELFKSLITKISSFELGDHQQILLIANANEKYLSKKEKKLLESIGAEVKDSARLSITRPSRAKNVLECIEYVLSGQSDKDFNNWLDWAKNKQ